MLTREAERRATRREHEQAWRPRQEPGDEPDVRNELFEVVQQQHHAAISEVSGEHVLHALCAFARTERLREGRSEQCRIVDGSEVDEHRAVMQLRPELGCSREREPSLARASRPGERDETHVVPPQERADGRHLEPAADELRRRRRKPQERGSRRFRSRERRIVAQDPALELLQLRAGVDPELVDQQLPRRSARGQRVHLPAGAIQRERVLGAKPLAIRLGRDQPLELGHELVVAAERELGVVEELERAQAPFPELPGLRLVHRLPREVGERCAGPERERLTKILGSVRGPLRGESVGGRLHEPLEAAEVELRRIER
ncbi:MAG TPA: hypothetical protein VGK69_04450 [Gaiellaceae bacterium]